MSGENCAIFGCPVNRRDKFKGISLFKQPGPSGVGHGKSDEEQKVWRDNFLSKITKDRTIDESFKKQIERGNIHVCEKHFDPSQIIAGMVLKGHSSGGKEVGSPMGGILKGGPFLDLILGAPERHPPPHL